MIFIQATKREFTQNAVGVFITLLAITLTVYLVQLLNRAAVGRIDAETVGPSLGFMTLNFMPTLLTLTLFISILSSLARIFRDSEMIIWETSGIPLAGFMKPVLLFALPIILLIAFLSLFLSPLAHEQNIKYQDSLKQRTDVSRVSPGLFRESRHDNRVLFAESIDEESRIVRNVFIHTVSHGELRLVTARQANIETADNGQRFVSLHDGQSYYGVPGEANYSVMNFKQYLVAFDINLPNERDLPTKAMSTMQLIDKPTGKNLSELLWRFNIPLVALGLSLIAIPLSRYNPRSPQVVNLIFAIVIFLAYTNFLSLGRSLVSDGKVSCWLATIMIHLLAVIMLACCWLSTKVYDWAINR